MVPNNHPACIIQQSFSLLLEMAAEVCNKLHVTSLNRQIEICRGLAGRSPLIDVAILGQFKAGKSSFLNSLIGRPLLPVGVIPVTTAITRIRYGDRDRAVVTHFDGTQDEIALDRLDEFTSEAKNPANIKDVAVVDIGLTSLAAYGGLRLVDTPGLGSVFKYHMETSENWLPEAGAAMLAISADRPLSEHDLALIQDLLRHTQRIVLLLTKADLLSAEQQAEVVRFFRETLKRELNREFPIFLYSTRSDQVTFKNRLEADLLLPLARNRDAEFAGILQYKLQSLGRSCREYLDIALQTSLRADADREGLRRQILVETINLTQIEEDLIVLTRAQAIHTRTHIDKYLSRFQAPLEERLTDALRNDLPTWQGNLWQLARRYEAWLMENLIVEIDALSVTERKHFFGTLIKAQAALDRYLDSFRALLGANIERVLGVKMSPASWKIEVAEPARPDISIGPVFEFHFDLLWFLIPMAIFRRFFDRHFLRLIPRQVYVNFSRLGAQWEMRINRAIEEMRKQAATYIREEIATIDALLSQSENQTESISKMKHDLEEALRHLNLVQQEGTQSIHGTARRRADGYGGIATLGYTWIAVEGLRLLGAL